MIRVYRVLRGVLAVTALTALTLLTGWLILTFKIQCEYRLETEKAQAEDRANQATNHTNGSQA